MVDHPTPPARLQGYDIIGDIHGFLQPLLALLRQLGYVREEGRWQHPEQRQVLFVGDYVDRGPEMLGVITAVRELVDQGVAQAIAGNHELNLLAMLTPMPDGGWARRRASGRRRDDGEDERLADFEATCGQLAERLPEVVEWLRGLPLWLDLGHLRVVHACWDPSSMRIIEQALCDHGGMSDAFMSDAFAQRDALYHAVETVCKGCEITLPDGHYITTGAGVQRKHARVQWYTTPSTTMTIADWTMPPGSSDCPLPAAPFAQSVPGYPDQDPPVFIGHYWWEPPLVPLKYNVACVDFGVAREAGHDNPAALLVAYRWSGEQTLSERNFVAVSR